MDNGARYRGKPLAIRFWDKVEKTDGCWLWKASRNANGYGIIGVPSGSKLAHRISYSLSVGDPGNLCVLHRCDNPQCVNPSHLFLGTKKDNTQDMLKKGRAWKPVGEQVRSHKLTEAQAKEIKERLKIVRHGDVKRVAMEFGITKRQAYAIAKGQCWKHLN